MNVHWEYPIWLRQRTNLEERSEIEKDSYQKLANQTNNSEVTDERVKQLTKQRCWDKVGAIFLLQ